MNPTEIFMAAVKSLHHTEYDNYLSKHRLFSGYANVNRHLTGHMERLKKDTE